MLLSFLVVGCSRQVDKSPNERAEAFDLAGKIHAKSTSSDVAMSPDQRNRIYARVRLDTVWHHENTTLLIGVAFRNEEEKTRLMAEVPKWFASTNLDTRCMAMMIVYFLKHKGFETSAKKLQMELTALPKRDVMQEGIVGYAESYLQLP